ncbi:MAG TPA: HD domain-containing phosphohydrolase [Acidobacteriaceae bacterium]|nr:HD domain-containing phosphohydrolase [Acidobacteriaceae bacterium]
MPSKILIADDDNSSRELLGEILTCEGFEVIAAGDGLEAFDVFGRFRPDIVLLDLQMPRLDGLEVCRRIKADPDTRLVPIVLITALSHVDDRVRGIRAGADDFLTKPVERHELIARVRSLLELKAFTDELERAESVLLALAQSIEGKDPYTRGHCERLSHYSARLGERLGLAETMIRDLKRAGFVHDIGKVAVPDAILLKAGPLTQEEMAVMKTHTIVGETICKPLKSFALVSAIIRHHHEKRDGSGYPDGLEGEQIPLGARILQLADVYDALTTVRPYKGALSLADALAVMSAEVERGWWDPELFPIFRDLVEREFAQIRFDGSHS